MVRGTEDKILSMFVDGKKHRGGIGTKLLSRFESEVKKLGSEVIRTKASIYAISFYQKNGYKKTTGIRYFHNLKVQPMKKVLE